MLPLGLGRNSAGLLRGGGVGSVPCALTGPSARFGHTLLRISSPRCLWRSPNPSCGSKPESFVARQSRRVAALASAADAGRIARTYCPGGGFACAAFAFGALPEAKSARCGARSCGRCADALTGGRSPASAGKRLSRRCSGDFMASPFCRGKLPGFSCVSGRMAETQAAGKALSPARSRKRAECGRPGLPHSG